MVVAAIRAIRERGENPSVHAVRREIGRGSMTTILRLMREVRGDRPSRPVGENGRDRAAAPADAVEGAADEMRTAGGPGEPPPAQGWEGREAARSSPGQSSREGEGLAAPACGGSEGAPRNAPDSGASEDLRALLRQIEKLTEATLLLARKLV